MQGSQIGVSRQGLEKGRDKGLSVVNNAFAPRQFRYIKLGQGGKWAADALSNGYIPFGYSEIDHRLYTAGRWSDVALQLAAMGRIKKGVADGLRELKDFYELPDDTLWVTMADGHVWWAFAQGLVTANSRDPGCPPCACKAASDAQRLVAA